MLKKANKIQIKLEKQLKNKREEKTQNKIKKQVKFNEEQNEVIDMNERKWNDSKGNKANLV